MLLPYDVYLTFRREINAAQDFDDLHIQYPI